MNFTSGSYTLNNWGTINVILGKNGCGKSTVLRQLDIGAPGFTKKKYITPERGGDIVYSPHVDADIQSSANYLVQSRRQNHDTNFRQKSIVLLRNLETLVNRGILADENRRKNTNETFTDTLDLINELLDNVTLRLSDKSLPDVIGKNDNVIREVNTLSSGEKELITLSIEILHFIYEFTISADANKRGLLLLDEPDVHLHPDLQYRFIKMLLKAVEHQQITIIISTHSTAILGALSSSQANVCFMRKGSTTLDFVGINETLKNILPIFGAHPLSNIFNSSPILLVEGEDDERIWQQAVRSSNGRIRVWPCQAGTITKLNEYEDQVSSMIDAVYEDAAAYSLRDRDTEPYDIQDKTNVLRARLNCYAAENLMLSDDVLNMLDTNWPALQQKITEWLVSNTTHVKHREMNDFAQTFDRRNHKLKGLEVTFLYLIGKSKPWEIAVGQAIARLKAGSSRADGSLADFLGPKIVDALGLCR